MSIDEGQSEQTNRQTGSQTAAADVHLASNHRGTIAQTYSLSLSLSHSGGRCTLFSSLGVDQMSNSITGAAAAAEVLDAAVDLTPLPHSDIIINFDC